MITETAPSATARGDISAQLVPGKERRQVERAISYWKQKVAQFGGPPPLMAIELPRMLNVDWRHRFLISTDARLENYAFLIYGAAVARLLDLADQAVLRVPMVSQLPRRYLDVFIQGCNEALLHEAPVRKNGSIDRWDGQVELYRSVFMPIAVRPNSSTSLIYGAFNRRVARQVAADTIATDA